MKRKILSLMVSVVAFLASPAFAMDEETGEASFRAPTKATDMDRKEPFSATLTIKPTSGEEDTDTSKKVLAIARELKSHSYKVRNTIKNGGYNSKAAKKWEDELKQNIIEITPDFNLVVRAIRLVEEELAQERKKEVDQIIEKIKRTMTQQPVQTSKL